MAYALRAGTQPWGMLGLKQSPVRNVAEVAYLACRAGGGVTLTRARVGITCQHFLLEAISGWPCLIATHSSAHSTGFDNTSADIT